MKKRFIFAGIVMGLFMFLGGQGFYDINTINELEITFAENNWDSILDSYYQAGDEERLTGSALINGVQFDSVGVRYKGNSTYNPNRIKNPLNIKLDHVIDDQTIDGYGTLKLANVYNDPSFVRETLSYEIARKYMPASEANYMKVTINGQYLGLYTSVQSVDKFFADTHFGNRDNAFFKGELTNDSPQNEVVVWGWLGDNEAVYADYYELKSDEGWPELVNFLDVFNNDQSEMEEVLNVDAHLWMLAFDNALVNLDAPVNFGHNFYLYQTGDGQFNPIIWDLNESFGIFAMLLGGAPLTVTGLQHLDPYLNENNSNYPIINKIMDDPVYKTRFIAHMKTILEENFDNGWYETRALEIQDIIDAEVQADPNKFYTYSNFLQNINFSIGNGPQQKIGITQLMEARTSYLLNLADFTADQPQIGIIECLPEAPVSVQEAQFSVHIDGAEEACLYHRSSEMGRFYETELFDDGQHDDGAAGDGLFANSFIANGLVLQYYVVADNADASAFSPARASYEYYTLNLVYLPTENIAINEFMADNDNIVADEAGEYDDWLELYNWSDESLDLSGYFLSDDPTSLDKWEIPAGVEIAAGGFLCFWADEDQEQGELHTNFKLSASGETIILTDPAGNVIDEITFDEQETDISFGRYPDGTGDFIQMTASFGAPNLDGVTENDNETIIAIPQISNYPNPFNPSTTIRFNITEEAYTELNIYNINGQLVKRLVSDNLKAGNQEMIWDGNNENGNKAASGVYFYNLSSGKYNTSGKMVLLK
ncbi:MAG: CotH kinase family protein [Candidatus Cloacimonetes bacterium]|nr:CotH kinase family protein [Candidatus Cloacimonadota bacterium]